MFQPVDGKFVVLEGTCEEDTQCALQNHCVLGDNHDVVGYLGTHRSLGSAANQFDVQCPVSRVRAQYAIGILERKFSLDAFKWSVCIRWIPVQAASRKRTFSSGFSGSASGQALAGNKDSMDHCPGFVRDVGRSHAWLVLAIRSLFVVFDWVVDLLVWHLATSKIVGSAGTKPIKAIYEVEQASWQSDHLWLENR
jgi:hypothetical protein